MPFLVVLVFLGLALIFAKLRLVRPQKLYRHRSLYSPAHCRLRGRFLNSRAEIRPFQGLLQISSAPLTNTSGAPWQIARWTSENGELRACDLAT